MNDKTMRETVWLWMGILQMANGQSEIGRANAEHYTWGQRCDGWYFVKNDEMTGEEFPSVRSAILVSDGFWPPRSRG
jgi:hypothetical protein